MLSKLINALAVAAFVCLVVGFGYAIEMASETSRSSIEHGTYGQKKYSTYHQTIKEREKPEEALARYTWWLTLFTGVLAFATIGLGGATLGLYLAGERQLQHAQAEFGATEFSRQVQFDQMTEQIGILRQSAEAADQLYP